MHITLELCYHLFDVQSELIPVAANWRNIGIALRLKPDILENINARYSGDPRACLSFMVMEWLRRNYDTQQFGEPTWRKLVEAVAHPAGGADKAVARKIAERHKAAWRYVKSVLLVLYCIEVFFLYLQFILSECMILSFRIKMTSSCTLGHIVSLVNIKYFFTAVPWLTELLVTPSSPKKGTYTDA